MQTIEAVIVNVDARVGVGLGFYGEIDLLGIIDLSLGLRYDLITIGYSQGEFYVVQTYFQGMEIAVWYIDKFEFQVDSGVRENPLGGPVGPWEEDTSNDIFVSAGAAGYLAAGGKFCIGIDTISLVEDLNRIFS